MTDSWQRNWTAFVDLLTEHLHAGTPPEELSRLFGAQEITWRGILEETSIDEIAPLVSIGLPSVTVKWGAGYSVILDGVSLPLASHAIEQWKTIRVGSSIAFTAKFVAANFIFSPIGIDHLKTGESTITIRLTHGVPIMDD